MPEHVVIIGNGVAGVTAARLIRKLSDRRITIISDETDFFYSRTALMYIYMGHMRFQDTKPYEDHFWAKNRIDTMRARVISVDPAARRVELASGSSIHYDSLVIATGSIPRVGPWKGVEFEGVHGLYHIEDLERLERATPEIRRAVVIGGGLIGVELSEMLTSRGIDVRFLVREDHYMDFAFPKEEATMIEREIRRHGVDLRMGTHVREILGRDGRVTGVCTTDGEEHAADFVGMAVGVRPNVAWLGDSGLEINEGILVDERFQTNHPGVFAIGDCAEFRDDGIGFRRNEQLWYTARRHGHALGRILCGAPGRYDRGVYFNSAKFFSLEHQVYGEVEPWPPGGEGSWFRSSPDRKKSIRIAYDVASNAVCGFLVMGTRLRHEVCERWIREQARLEVVLDHLDEAAFDPEFTASIVTNAAPAA